MKLTQKYIGITEVLAAPMTLKDYNTYRGWELDANENGSDMGYLIETMNIPRKKHRNHQNHQGYISWCPKQQFEEANRPSEEMTFGYAIEAAKQGQKIARKGWNGKNMFVFIKSGSYHHRVDPESPMGGDFESRPHFCMRDAQGKCVVGWLASQTDMLAEDWEIVD